MSDLNKMLSVDVDVDDLMKVNDGDKILSRSDLINPRIDDISCYWMKKGMGIHHFYTLDT